MTPQEWSWYLGPQMTTTVPNPESDAVAVGPPPPFDPELTDAPATTLDVIPERMPEALTADVLPQLRQAQAKAGAMTDEELSLDGAFTVSEQVAPGPAGEPDVSLAVCVPAKETTPVAAIYFIHGGGMLTGSNRGLRHWTVGEQGRGESAPGRRCRARSDRPAPAWAGRALPQRAGVQAGAGSGSGTVGV